MTIDLTQVAVALIGLASTVVTAFLIPLLKTKFTDIQWAKLQRIISIGVSAAEQLSNTGEIKKADRKEYVLNMIKANGVVEQLKRWGFTIDWDTVSSMVEAAVYDLPSKITNTEVKKLAEVKVEAMAEATVEKKVTAAVESKLPEVVEQKVQEAVNVGAKVEVPTETEKHEMFGEMEIKPSEE